MKKIILMLLGFTPVMLQAQDSLRYSCSDTTALIRFRPGNATVMLRRTAGDCDSVYLLPSWKYQQMKKELRTCKSFVQLYRFYRDEVKKGDVEVAAIVEGYEGIIRSKDEAYNRLMEEYSVLNGLLDSSIAQTGAAVDISRASLKGLESSLNTMAASNENLRKDIKDLQKINRRNKWAFGLAGFALGFVAGFIIAQ